MAPAADLGEFAAWNPTLLVRTARQSSAGGSSSQRVIYAASVAKQFTAFLAALLVPEDISASSGPASPVEIALDRRRYVSPKLTTARQISLD